MRFPFESAQTLSVILPAAAVFVLLVSGLAAAHCDTMGGPVIAAAREAIGKGDVTPVLKWVKPEHEAEIRNVFAMAMKVRGAGPEARDLADMYFFETLVRLHRAGEGEPYTGLKPAEEVEPIVELSDRALESGDPEALISHLNGEIAAGIRERFKRASEARKDRDKSVRAGREFVEAYVDFTHYVERLYVAGAGRGLAHGHK